MQIVIKVSATAEPTPHPRDPPTPDSDELLGIAVVLGATLEPMHPGTSDPDLRTYFTVEVPDQESAQRLIERARHLEAVDAAYIKPPDQMP